MKNLISSLLAVSVAVISSMPFAAIAQSNPRPPELCKILDESKCENTGTFRGMQVWIYKNTLSQFLFYTNQNGTEVYYAYIRNETSPQQSHDACNAFRVFSGFPIVDVSKTKYGDTMCLFHD